MDNRESVEFSTAPQSLEAVPVNPTTTTVGQFSYAPSPVTLDAPPPIPKKPFGSSRIWVLSGTLILLSLLAGGMVLAVHQHHTKAAVAQQISLPKLSSAAPSLPTFLQTTGLSSKSATLGKVQVTSELHVQGSVTIQGNTTISDALTASALSTQTLAVSGPSVLADVALGNLTANGTVTVKGTIVATGGVSGTFTGSFAGDGANITNISARNCADCVRLQQPPTSLQDGTIAITGDITGRDIAGRRLSITSGAMSSLQVQTLDGQSILVADTQNKTITLATILPVTSGSVTPGVLQAGFNSQAVTPATFSTSNISHKWAVAGNDGLMRFVYADMLNHSISYVRCLDIACTTKTTTTIETDPANGLYYPTIALDANGNPYMAYLDAVVPYEEHLAHCLDANCSQKTIQTIGTGAPYAESGSLMVDGQNHADFVYDALNFSPESYALQFIHCLNADCSSKTNSTLAQSTAHYNYYDTSVLVKAPDGLPRLLYAVYGTHTLQFKRCTSYDCSSGPTTIVENGNAGFYNSLAIGSDGLAKLLYLATNNELHYETCIDADCTSITTPVSLAGNAPTTTGFADLTLTTTNLPLFSYSAPNTADPNNSLHYAYCSDVACSALHSLIVDPNTSNSSDSSIIVGANGYAQLVYDSGSYQANTAGYRVATINTADGQAKLVGGRQDGGTGIGTSTQRFGALYGQTIDLQADESATMLNLNLVPTGVTPAGYIANFAISGVSKVNIDQTGRLNATGITTTDLTIAPLQDGVGVTIKGANGQTANILQAVDSTNAELFSVSATGNLNVSGTINAAGIKTVPITKLNYIPDPTFTATSPGRGSGTRALLTGSSGTATGRAIKITPNNDWTTVSQTCAIPSNGSYTMSFIAWTDTSSEQITALDGPGNIFGSIKATTTPTRYTITWNHGAGCNSFELGPNGGTTAVYIADWQVEAGPATSFIYGDAGAGYSWLGAANNSTSQRLAGIYAGNGLFSPTLVVSTALFSGTITVNGHLITGNASGTTTATAGAFAGSGAQCTVSGNDTSGIVTMNMGSNPSTGAMCIITFATNYGTVPHVFLTPYESNSATLQYYVSAPSANGFTLSSGTPPAANASYNYFYHVEQ